MAEDRIGLESKLAQLERTVDALNGELFAHQQHIERLQQQLDALLLHVRRLGPGGDPIEPHDTRPPHWGG